MSNIKGARAADCTEENCRPISDHRYVCCLCINWLNEPVLASCGHRFCKSCIDSWLRNQSKCCPLDNKELFLVSDDYTENSTKRQNSHNKREFSNTKVECNVSSTKLGIENRRNGSLKNKINIYECPFNRLNCRYKSDSQLDLGEHIKGDMHEHLNVSTKLGLKEFNKQLVNPATPKVKHPTQKELKAKRTEADETLVKTLYDRIVLLEEKSREQETKIEKMSREISVLSRNNHAESKNNSGIILWQMEQISKKIELMSGNPNIRFYSSSAYTSPYGYKFCARMNIPLKTKEFLSLHVHMMQSADDFHLDWPFKGRIKISMIHPTDQSKTQQDTIMSKPEILAFHRPVEDISPRGFGFLEYANISDIFSKGFVQNDELVIKIQINIV